MEVKFSIVIRHEIHHLTFIKGPVLWQHVTLPCDPPTIISRTSSQTDFDPFGHEPPAPHPPPTSRPVDRLLQVPTSGAVSCVRHRLARGTGHGARRVPLRVRVRVSFRPEAAAPLAGWTSRPVCRPTGFNFGVGRFFSLFLVSCSRESLPYSKTRNKHTRDRFNLI